jgi:hypothetical protein
VNDQPTLLVKVLSRLGQVDVREAWIEPARNEREVYGLWEPAEETGSRPCVTINPAPQVVKVLIHELLHELHPEWSENYIRNRASFVMNMMSSTQIWAVYEEYRRRVDNEKGD